MLFWQIRQNKNYQECLLYACFKMKSYDQTIFEANFPLYNQLSSTKHLYSITYQLLSQLKALSFHEAFKGKLFVWRELSDDNFHPRFHCSQCRSRSKNRPSETLYWTAWGNSFFVSYFVFTRNFLLMFVHKQNSGLTFLL